MKSLFILLSLSLCLFLPGYLSSDVGVGSHNEEIVSFDSIPSKLLGTWQTHSIHGDALFLVIKEIRVTLKRDNTFIATVEFVDFSRKTMRGTVKADGKYLYFMSTDSKRSGKVLYHLNDD